MGTLPPQPGEPEFAFPLLKGVPMHLLTVEGALNRQKGDSNPHDWQPPREDFWCEYATAWQGVKDRWGLAMTPRQEDAVEGMHRTSGRLYAR